MDVSFEQVYAELKERDDRDMNRSVDPLHIADGAWVLDTSPLTIDEVVDVICARVKELRV